MQCDLAPLCSAVYDQQNVANLRGFECSSRDARLLDQLCNIQQSGKIEVSTHAAELAHFGGQFLLLSNPGGVGGRCKRSNPRLAQRRRRVSAQQFAQSVELQHTRGVVDERWTAGHRHRDLCYRNARTRMKMTRSGSTTGRRPAPGYRPGSRRAGAARTPLRLPACSGR